MGISLMVENPDSGKPEFGPTLIGRRIELTHMPDDPDPVPVGSVGVIEKITRWPDGTYQLNVRWENAKRTLAMVCPPDQFRILE